MVRCQNYIKVQITMEKIYLFKPWGVDSLKSNKKYRRYSRCWPHCLARSAIHIGKQETKKGEKT